MKKTTKKPLEKTRKSLSDKINSLVSSFRKVDEDFFEELEELLILSDMGATTSFYIIEKLRNEVKKNNIKDSDKIKTVLSDIISSEMECDKIEITPPSILLVVGVNGAGKTTFIGKLANMLKNQGNSIVLAAADTFRAAASEQLVKWAKKANVSIVKHHEGSDPSAVIFDAILSAKAKKTDVLICDTAGRLHNKKNLMDELSKINRVIEKEYSEANKITFLVIDATNGQNAINQAKSFKQTCDVDGLVLNKLDGTAKGGVAVSIKKELDLPICFVGVGEQIDDLMDFDAEDFARNLLG